MKAYTQLHTKRHPSATLMSAVDLQNMKCVTCTSYYRRRITYGLFGIVVLQSSVKYSVDGCRTHSSTTNSKCAYSSTFESKWIEESRVVKLAVKIRWVSCKYYTVIGHGNEGRVTFTLRIMSQFRDVEGRTYRPQIIKNSMPALPTTSERSDVCKFKFLSSER
jgi:hypothetical protein